MSMIALILVVMFLLLLVMNVPIAVSIAMASFFAILVLVYHAILLQSASFNSPRKYLIIIQINFGKFYH